MKMNFNNIIKKALVKGYKLKILVQNALKIIICTIYCLLYTSDAADEGLGVDHGGRGIIK